MVYVPSAAGLVRLEKACDDGLKALGQVQKCLGTCDGAAAAAAAAAAAHVAAPVRAADRRRRGGFRHLNGRA